MNNRERTLALLRYQPYDRLPIVHFGFWDQTLEKWFREGHLTEDEAHGWTDGNDVDLKLAARLGFDYNWQTMFHSNCGLDPAFEQKVVKVFPDGMRHVLGGNGVVIVQQPGTVSIPQEIDHLLKDRASWKEHFEWRHQWSERRVNIRWLESLKPRAAEAPLGLHCGSLFGYIRLLLGLKGVSYLYVDDEPLFREIIDAVAELCYRNTEYTLKTAPDAGFAFAHFWEDICFKNGPLLNPNVFREYVGPHYRRITELVGRHGLDIVSVDCDGMIDALVPVWLENGVNTMFPIEVGTWNASIAPWREKYGRDLRGVGGMNKNVFALGKAAVDAEIERLKPLVELGGFIPCPDHRIAPDAEFRNVCYYTERMRKVFG